VPHARTLATALATLALVAEGDNLVADEVLRALRPVGPPATATDDVQPGDGRDRRVARALADVAACFAALATERDRARAAEEEWRHRATHDELTGLPNRQLLIEHLERKVASAVDQGTAVAVLFIDVDGFKGINDTFGHGVGDLVLAEVARTLCTTLRSHDVLGRLAGDEFAAVCGDLAGSAERVDHQLITLGARIHAALRTLPSLRDVGRPVSVSVGASVTTSWRSAQELLHHADVAMYTAKQAGGRRLVISSGSTV
jgi:diguanylate cyclase (GGDEF)-like protein